MLSRLQELHLGIVTEYETAAPETNIEKSELHSFFNDGDEGLSKAWLRPVHEHLTHLTLFVDTYWGWAPAFPAARSLHLAKLKYLALGNFTFAHDWQVDWILAHGSSLKTLIMDDCPM